MSLRQIPILVLTCVSLAGFEYVPQRNAEAYVALMEGQKARPLNGTFNNVPVLHSNQPEIVTGPGILVNTAAGSAIAAESNQPLRNAAHSPLKVWAALRSGWLASAAMAEPAAVFTRIPGPVTISG